MLYRATSFIILCGMQGSVVWLIVHKYNVEVSGKLMEVLRALQTLH